MFWAGKENITLKMAGLPAETCWRGILFYLPWLNSPTQAQVAPLMRFLYHEQLEIRRIGHIWTSDQLVAEATT